MCQPVVFPRIEFNANLHDLGQMTVTTRCSLCAEILSPWTDGTIRHPARWDSCPQRFIDFRMIADANGFWKFEATEIESLPLPATIAEAVPEEVAQLA